MNLVDRVLEDLKSPTNVILLIILAVLSYLVFIKKEKSQAELMKEYILEDLEFKEYNKKELSKFDGSNRRILIAVKNDVFDVSQDGPYSIFAGRDASRGLALNSFSPDVLNSLDDPIDDLEGLDSEEKEALEEWYELFKSKYPLVGKLT